MLAWILMHGWLMFWRCRILRQPFRFKMFHSRWFTCDTLDLMSFPNVEVVSAVTGESIAVFEKDEFADASVKALKQRLAKQIGVPRFRLRLLQDNSPLDEDQTLAMQVVQLVRMEFLPPDMEQDRGIMVACEESDGKLLEQHLNQPRNPNFEDSNGTTPLCTASLNGNLNCVSLLIEAGANKDQGRKDTGATPLWIAAYEEHLEVVQFLAESGANKDQGRTDNGATPLYMAAQNGHLEVVRFLVESGANKDQGRKDTGATPLFVAVNQGHLEVVRFLVESGANKDQGRTDDGVTPLWIAAHHGHLEVVRLLVEYGANKDQGTTHDETTPLSIAAQNGHLEVVQFLVESGANKRQKRHHRWWRTPPLKLCIWTMSIWNCAIPRKWPRISQTLWSLVKLFGSSTLQNLQHYFDVIMKFVKC